MNIILKYIKQVIYPLLIIGGILSSNAQTFTYSGYIYGSNAVGVSGIPVYLYKRTTTTSVVSNLTTKIYSTHGGNGSTTQYASYPMSLTEMDKCFNTAFSNTTLKWSGTVAATTCLNWSTWTTLSSAGVTIPNNGEYFSTEVTSTFIPKETGIYTFGVNSDDGGDILINGTLVTSYYGGHGMSGPINGTISLVAGTSYTFKARMQEAGGGEGLAVTWKRPSQSILTLQTDEIGTTTTTTSAWTLQSTSTTSALGVYSFSTPTGTGVEFYITFTSPLSTIPTLSDGIFANGKAIGSTTIKSIDYFRYDVNGDNKFTVSDTYSILARKSGILSTFSITPSSKIFNSTEWSNINTSTLNLKATYPGAQSVVINSPVSGGTSNYYITRLGNTN